ncbi:4'-phosphopantetheinyl transferase family protein [Paenibacillus athensensis]|nr:4'-phosphopantetheinyl transferase superfamily protein [Paenibacillus athensensis]
MMIEIAAVSLAAGMDEGLFTRLLNVIPPAKAQAVLRFMRRADRERSLAAELLARRQLALRWGIDPLRQQWIKNGYGKPALPAPAPGHFNLSHAGDWVVLATHSRPVGIDVEQIQPIEAEIAEHYFSPEEQAYVNSAADGWTERFFDIWTLKESYIKAVGQGLSIPLTSFSFRLAGPEPISVSCGGKQLPYAFRQYALPGPYRLAVCATAPEWPTDVKLIRLEELAAFFLNGPTGGRGLDRSV